MLNFDRDYALKQDELDSLKHIRKEFIIPSKQDLTSKTLIDHCKIYFFVRGEKRLILKFQLEYAGFLRNSFWLEMSASVMML